MDLSQKTMQSAQDQYFDKLEENYQREKKKNQNLKDYTIQMCIKIQRFIKQKQLKKKIRIIFKIQYWWKQIFKKKKDNFNKIQRVRMTIAKYRVFYFLQKIYKKKRVLLQIKNEFKVLQSLQYSKLQIQKIKFLQTYFSSRYQMRKQYLRFLMKQIKTKLKVNKMLQNQREITYQQASFFKQQLMTKIAFSNEIQFLNNTIEYNSLSFQRRWDQYENKLSKFMKGRNKDENYIEQRNAYGESVWTNIKTMEQSLINPVEQNLSANLKKFKQQAVSEFMESNKYLEQARQNLMIQKLEYEQISNDLYFKFLRNQ